MSGVSSSQSDELKESVAQICGQILDGAANISDLRRLTGGTSHDSWAFDAKSEASPAGRALIIRRDFSDEILDVDLATEFNLLSQLFEAGLKVPQPLLYGDTGSAIGGAYIISERLAGGDIRKLMATKNISGAKTGRELVRLQAEIHGLDWRKLTDGLLHDGGDNNALYQIEHWAGIAQKLNRNSDPLLAATINWLRNNAPVGTPLCLVHGDYKANNLVAGAGGRVAIIDWELAHIGDPMEDLAWTMLWTTPHDIVGGMMSAVEYIAAYEAVTGAEIDQGRLGFWRLFVLMKLQAIFLKSMSLHGKEKYPQPTHIMLGRAIPWLHHHMSRRLSQLSAKASAT